MADENTQIIKFENMQQKTGNSEDLPVLINGEFGFSEDTTQLFIGSDPQLSLNSNFNIVEIEPFVNAKAVVQSYLDNSVDYSSYTVTDEMIIETGSQESAVEIVDYINTVHRNNLEDQDKQFIKPIARIQSNIEIMTSRNVQNYANPADFNVKFGPVERVNSKKNKVLFQELDTSVGDTFLKYDIQDVLYLNVEYVLLQDNGRHKRAGTIRVIADNNDAYSGTIAFSDNYDVINDVSDKIEFTAQVINNEVTINFIQPEEQSTKIFYRLSRWNLEDYEEGSTNIYEDYIAPLSTDDDIVIDTSN